MSIITTRGVWVRSARYSVCPENATPASLITPLHRGGDHGGKLPGRTAVNRGVERVEHIAAVGGVEHAGLGWRGERHMQHLQTARRGGASG